MWMMSFSFHFIFRFIKKVEHSWKSLLHDGVCALPYFVSSVCGGRATGGILSERESDWLVYLLFRTQCQFTGPISMRTDFWTSWARLYSDASIVSGFPLMWYQVLRKKWAFLKHTCAVFFVFVSQLWEKHLPRGRRILSMRWSQPPRSYFVLKSRTGRRRKRRAWTTSMVTISLNEKRWSGNHNFLMLSCPSLTIFLSVTSQTNNTNHRWFAVTTMVEWYVGFFRQCAVHPSNRIFYGNPLLLSSLLKKKSAFIAGMYPPPFVVYKLQNGHGSSLLWSKKMRV